MSARRGRRSGSRPSGRIDAFVTATGTGGTLGGVSRYLKRQINDRGQKVQITLADPQGSSLYHWLRHGELKATGPGSITEGIGIGRVTANLEGAPDRRRGACDGR